MKYAEGREKIIYNDRFAIMTIRSRDTTIFLKFSALSVSFFLFLFSFFSFFIVFLSAIDYFYNFSQAAFFAVQMRQLLRFWSPPIVLQLLNAWLTELLSIVSTYLNTNLYYLNDKSTDNGRVSFVLTIVDFRINNCSVTTRFICFIETNAFVFDTIRNARNIGFCVNWHNLITFELPCLLIQTLRDWNMCL